jgi:hypothetical protein
MATNPAKRQGPEPNGSVIRWLLDSDPSIRWQAMRDLIGAPADEVAAERARVATEGAGARLLALQEAYGGWNCEAPNRSTRSSFNTTICVLEALLEHERAGGAGPEVTAARLRGEEYLLERRLFRRRSTGEVIERDRKGDAVWTRFAFPTWWHYDVLRGLEYLCCASVVPDERVAEAIDLVASKRDGDGRWPLETQYPGKMPVETDEGEARPSRWNTLRALRVLSWFQQETNAEAAGRGDWQPAELASQAHLFDRR